MKDNSFTKEEEEALKFYNLTYDYTENSLKNAHREFLKKYHPDLNAGIDYNDNAKKANTYYYLLAKKFNSISEEEKNKLTILKFDFESYLEGIKKRYLYSFVNSLCDEYIKKILYANRLSELNRLRLDFSRDFNKALEKNKREAIEKNRLRRAKEEFETILKKDSSWTKIAEVKALADDYLQRLEEITNIKDLEDLKNSYFSKTNNNKKDTASEVDKESRDTKSFNYAQQMKKNLKKYFAYTFSQLKGTYSEELEAEYEDFMKDLNFLIEGLKESQVEMMLPKLNKIKFQNIDEDRKVLEEFDLPLYIDRFNGTPVILKRKEEENALYHLLGDLEIKEIPNRKFENQFISLKNFIRTAAYVYDKDFHLPSVNGEDIYIDHPFQDYIYATPDIALAHEKGRGENEEFIFYTRKTYQRHEPTRFVYSESKNKKNSYSKFQDKETTYEILLNYYRMKIKEKERDMADDKTI